MLGYYLKYIGDHLYERQFIGKKYSLGLTGDVGYTRYFELDEQDCIEVTKINIQQKDAQEDIKRGTERGVEGFGRRCWKS